MKTCETNYVNPPNPDKITKVCARILNEKSGFFSATVVFEK